MSSEPRQPSEEQLRAAYEEEIKRLRVEHILLDNVAALANLGMRRTGLAPGTEGERDPEQVRLAIEAIRALLPLLEQTAPSQIAAIRDAVSQLQIAFVKIGGQAAPAGAAAAGAAEAARRRRARRRRARRRRRGGGWRGGAGARPSRLQAARAKARRPRRSRPSRASRAPLSAAGVSGCRASSASVAAGGPPWRARRLGPAAAPGRPTRWARRLGRNWRYAVVLCQAACAGQRRPARTRHRIAASHATLASFRGSARPARVAALFQFVLAALARAVSLIQTFFGAHPCPAFLPITACSWRSSAPALPLFTAS